MNMEMNTQRTSVDPETVREINESKSPVTEEKYAKYESVYRDMVLNGAQRQAELDMIVDQLIALGENDDLESTFAKIEDKVLTEADEHKPAKVA